jgi:hypothetical protein
MHKVALLAVLGVSGTLAQPFQVRLDSPLTSYGSPAGTTFTATVISPLEANGQLIIPQGSVIHGTVMRASAVGLGLVHERAMLDLAFEQYELPDGQQFPLEARLDFIENAREQVDRRGRIRGVLAASNPQGLLRGIWYRPTENFFNRSAIGLTGLGGTLWSHFSLGPFGAAGMLAARYIAFSLPEPEIQLPSGTEMRLLATSIPRDVPTTPVPPDLIVDGSLASWLEQQTRVVTKPDGTRAQDVINLAFIGGAEELQNAFSAAGWVPAEPRTLHSLSTTYRAYNAMQGYATAPVSMLLYQGAAPAVVFQKSFNTIAKRHHVRIWRAGDFEGNEIWLGAATHDAGVGFRMASMTITHKIDPRTDGERGKIVTDLNFEGCSDKVSYLSDSPDDNWVPASDIQTDGRLAVVWLRTCAGSSPEENLQHDPIFRSPGSKTKRMARRFVLETRQYFLRDNMYYWAIRATIMARRNALRDMPPAQ